MVFSDTSSSKAGIIQECESILFGDSGYGSISGDTNLLATFTRRANIAMDRVASLIRRSDGRWQWDDANNTTHPIATTNLVANQQDYALDTTMLEITRVECVDINGNAQLLNPIDQTDVTDQALTQYYSTASSPIYYDKIGGSIFLYPKPSYNATGGLKIYFERSPNYFVTSDTTKAPGFHTDYHMLIALWPAYQYAKDKQLANKNDILAQIQAIESELQNGYMKRGRDEHIKLRVRRQIWR